MDLTNPAGNVLPRHLSEDMVVRALEDSGLPVQTLVAARLRAHFVVEEEWAYVDGKSGELRTLDVRAFSYNEPRFPQPRVRPHFNLLIECKKTASPFVFIATDSPFGMPSFPVVAGLPHEYLTIHTDDSLNRYHYPVIDALSLANEPLVAAPAKSSRYVSRALPTKNGAAAEFGGSEAYSSTVQPLLTALEYFPRYAKPEPTFYHFECHAVIAVCVVAGPMAVASVASDGQVSLQLEPWVRLSRQGARPEAHRFERSPQHVIDYVHFDFLDDYISDYVIPFAELFAERVLAQDEVVASGRGFVPGMESRRYGETFDDLRPVGDLERARAWPFKLWRLAGEALDRTMYKARARKSGLRRPSSLEAREQPREGPYGEDSAAEAEG